jgi:hypothetical protein
VGDLSFESIACPLFSRRTLLSGYTSEAHMAATERHLVALASHICNCHQPSSFLLLACTPSVWRTCGALVPSFIRLKRGG